MPEGTSIEVGADLDNLPARRKFLSRTVPSLRRSRASRHNSRCVIRRSGSRWTSAGRKVLQCPPVSSLRDRLFQLYGERADLVEGHREAET